MTIGLRFPDGAWLILRVELPSPRPWHSSTFLLAFVMMTAAAGAMTIWAVRRMTLPVATLASAADRLGRDVNAPPLPEAGPEEIRTAAAAFNIMAERIRRFVQDRTFMLAAIGHDLRTPITRLRLRAEFIDDETVRARMLADLDELEAMVSATLAFGQDATAQEPPSRLDLAELVRTILDETADAMPDFAGPLLAAGPEHLTIQAQADRAAGADQLRRQCRQIRRRGAGDGGAHRGRQARGQCDAAGGRRRAGFSGDGHGADVPAVPAHGAEPQPGDRRHGARPADRAQHRRRAWRRCDFKRISAAAGCGRRWCCRSSVPIPKFVATCSGRDQDTGSLFFSVLFTLRPP